MNQLKLKLKLTVAGLLILANLLYVPALGFADTLSTPPTPPVAPVAPVAPIPPAPPTPPVAPTAPTPPAAPVPPVAPAAPAAPTTPTTTTNNPVVDITSNPANNTGTTIAGTPSNSATNSGNGTGSTNSTSGNSTNSTGVVDVNNANVTNNQTVNAGTGGNTADKNMGNGSIQTGNAAVSSGLMNDINNNTVTIGDLCGLGCSAGFVAANLQNGNGTLNNSNGQLTNLVLVNNSNNLNLKNNANISASTGINDASKNMGSGVIVSGDANVAFTTVNLGNNNGINATSADYNIVDNQSRDLWINFPTGTASGAGLGQLGANNSSNGAGSTNNATSNSSNSTVLDNNNNLVLNNDVNLYANTGNNTANKNMGAGNVTTGNANIVSNVINFLNNNIVAGAQWLLSTINIFGNMTGNIILPRNTGSTTCSGCPADVSIANSGNGSGSTNNASSTTNNTTTINNTNDAAIKTNLNINSNTGGNTADKNMGNSSITTGNTNVKSNLVTVANTNAVGQGDTWWLVIVNNHGSYTGSIMGADGATIAGSDMTFGTKPDGSLYVVNSGNGAGSNNNASTTSNNSTTINNTNTASVTNNININATTGNNTVDKNMAGANIKTGNVNVVSNIVNFINNNFVGKKFVVTLVNIFGSFSGKIIPPNQPLPVAAGGIGGSTNPAAVNLSSSTTLSGNTGGSAGGSTSGQSHSGGGGSSLGANTLSGISQALADSGTLLKDTAILQKSSDNPITKVINNSSAKSGFQFNFVLLGIAILVLAAYTVALRRKSFTFFKKGGN